MPDLLEEKVLQSRTTTIDMEFAFNDHKFSDRLLHVEIIPDSLPSAACDFVINDKRKREMANGDAAQGKTVHISSAILAAHSPFFFKLFTNGMRESIDKDVTLKINASEETGLMDLLKFMYSHTLRASSTSDLLDVLMVADKFEVTSCVKYCIELLKKKPMSLKGAISYIGLPSHVSFGEALLSLKNEANQYLLDTFGDLVKSQEKVMELSLLCLKGVLRVDGLKVDSEDQVFDLIVKWGRAHYPNVKERQKILSKHLVQFIYFPYMSSHKLEELLVCGDFLHGEVSKLVLEALHFSAGYPYGQGILLKKYELIIQREYKYHPIKVVNLESSRCLVYLFLTKDEVKSLYPCNLRRSQPFLLGGRWFSLKVARDEEYEEFGMYLKMLQGSEACKLDYEFAAMKRTSKEFRTRFKKTNSTFKAGNYWGKMQLFGIPWTNFVSDHNVYFINDVLHLRAEITINNP